MNPHHPPHVTSTPDTRVRLPPLSRRDQSMIRLRIGIELDYQIAEPGCDFIFNIHAAHTERQRVVEEALTLSQDVNAVVETDTATRNRYLRVNALAGKLQVRYAATVDLSHYFAEPESIAEFPSRACPRRC